MSIALAVLVVSWQFSESSGKWQDAVREELREALAVQENTRRVYGRKHHGRSISPPPELAWRDCVTLRGQRLTGMLRSVP
ncbi:hypothetical protein [Kibdelosporangium aridum]|uniref:hypothetical protein n=1 Tax=Kibdelosporangium aridum TaxID=2030 RepID=UPI000527C1BB